MDARISLGMPVYNAAALLPQALEALLEQTFGDFELVISDNASTDQTEDICRDYAARDPRIRYVRQPVNRGASWNFNEVFRLARAPYFKWAAYDDLCLPTYLERCVEVLDRQPEVLWVHSRSRHINAQGELLNGPNTPQVSYLAACRPAPGHCKEPTRDDARPSERFRAVLLGHGGCLDSYGLIRREVLEKTQLLIPVFGSEKVLMAELALWGRYAEVPEPLFLARVHPAAAGYQRDAKRQRRFINPFGSRWQFGRWQLLKGYVRAVRHSPVNFSERQRCYRTIARWVCQVHKWKSVVVKALTGKGLAGEYPAPEPAGNALHDVPA